MIVVILPYLKFEVFFFTLFYANLGERILYGSILSFSM